MSWPELLRRIVDVAIVAFIFYRILLLVQGTRAAQMILGMLALVAVSVISAWVKLDTLNSLLASLKTVWIVAFIVLFQPELRRGLAQIGQSRLFRRFVRTESFGIVGHVVRAAEEMSRRRMGGIFVIERGVGLKNYLETGVALNAEVHADLLLSIFNTSSPLHDGAVILVGNQLSAARCILPLSQARIPRPGAGHPAPGGARGQRGERRARGGDLRGDRTHLDRHRGLPHPHEGRHRAAQLPLGGLLVVVLGEGDVVAARARGAQRHPGAHPVASPSPGHRQR